MNRGIVEKTIKELLRLLDVSHEIEILEDESLGTKRFLIKTGEPDILIGRDGAHLAALSHIVKRITEKGLGEDKEQSAFVVDVNNYQGKKIEDLKNKATILAERARYFKSDVEMSPMSPYERMIVHSIFTNVKDIKTESLGEGRGRRVVLRYIEGNEE